MPVKAIATAVAALMFVIAPAVTDPFSGYTAAQLPVPQPDPVIQPPGWMFSIWGVIYTWLLLGTGFGLWKAADDPDWQPMRPWLTAALLLGAVWLAIANSSPVWATVTIALMAALAIVALLRSGTKNWWWQVGPVAIFAGWLTAATGVSTAVTVAGFGVLRSELADPLVLCGVLVVALWVMSRRPTAWPYAVGTGWALAGVSLEAWSQSAWLVLVLALSGGGALGLIVIRPHGVPMARQPD